MAKNLKLYNSILNSDFCFLDSKNSKNHFTKKNIGLSKNISTSILNIELLLKSLKQFILLIKFLKSCKNALLQIVVPNKQQYYLITEFFKTEKLNSTIKIKIITTLNYSSSNDSEKINSLTIFFDSFHIINNLNFMKTLNSSSIFLIQKINSKVEKNNYGYYKLYNNFNDIKKVLYFSILIKKLL